MYSVHFGDLLFKLDGLISMINGDKRIVDNANVDVSIYCPTFNHEEFIAEALDSFLKQKCGYSFEIVVRDDASTDSTTDVVKKFQAENPGKIRLIVNEKNEFLSHPPIADVDRLCRGRYIAMCEGDDYWLSDSVLDEKIEILERDSSISLVRSGEIQIEDGIEIGRRTHGGLRSFVFRRPILLENLEHMAHFDRYLLNILAGRGRVVTVKKFDAVWRKHPGGMFGSILKSRAVLRYERLRVEFWSAYYFFSKNDKKKAAKHVSRILFLVLEFFDKNRLAIVLRSFALFVYKSKFVRSLIK